MKPADIIEMELNCYKHTLKFYRNGNDQGVAFEDLKLSADKSWYFVVAMDPLWNKSDIKPIHVKILNFSTTTAVVANYEKITIKKI